MRGIRVASGDVVDVVEVGVVREVGESESSDMVS